MQIFCRGTVYAKGAKGDIFMYITQFGPKQARYAVLNRKNCALCTKAFTTTNFVFDQTPKMGLSASFWGKKC